MSPKVTLRVLASVASLGLTAISSAAALASQTAFGSAPVSVNACSTEVAQASASPYETPRISTDLRYRFVNNATVAARSVTVDVTLNGQSSRIVESGTFAPGVAISRETENYANTYVTGSVACRVARVDFIDGTSWQRSSAADVSAR